MFNLGRKEQAVILIILAVVLFTVGYRFASKAEEAPVELVGSSNDPSEQKENGPTVHIVGAVEKPGVYKLSPGSRVNDALTQAVPLPEADIESLNLAATLKDEQRLVVSARADNTTPEESGVKATPSASSTKSKGLININTATELELDGLPGIGPTLAARIAQHRQTNGAFQAIEELKDVSGIGDKKYEDLQHLITVQ